MRTPSERGIGTRIWFVALVAVTVFALVACGQAAPSSAPPTARPTPTATPDPHLSDPATAEDVWRGLGAAGLRITASNATAGDADSDLVARINATYLGWPLNLSEYRASEALADETDWKPGEKPGQGEAPVAIVGANILVTWGPQTGKKPKQPDDRQLEGLDALVDALDRLLSPLRARSVIALDVAGASEPPTSASDATTAEGRGDAGALRSYPAAVTPDGRPRPRSNSTRPGDDVSELDKRIIEHLQTDGRRPFTQIASDLGVSEAAVRARTNRLIDRGILQIVGVTDPLKLGFHQMAMIGIRCESDQLVTVAEQVAEMPEVDYVVITAGTYDLLIETVCEDNEALLRFLTDKLRAIEGVRETETFVYLRMVKQTYQWGTR